MSILHFSIVICIFLLFLIILWLSYKIYQNRKILRLDHEQQSMIDQHCDENLLKFDREIHQILHNPNLSDIEKEQLTNQCAEKYLNSTQS